VLNFLALKNIKNVFYFFAAKLRNLAIMPRAQSVLQVPRGCGVAPTVRGYITGKAS
jgi:hypothetical protein